MTLVGRLRSVQIEGPRVRIRGLEKTDLSNTFAWRNDDRSLRWFKNATPLQWESHVSWYDKYQASDEAGCMFFVESSEGSPVGQSSIYNVDGDSAEVGRFLSQPELRGAGLFREALLLTLFAAFDLAHLKRVHLEVIENNDRAVRLYKSVGFEATGATDGLLQMDLTAERFGSIRDDLPFAITTQGSL